MSRRDWDYIALCLADIEESLSALKQWDKKDMDEYYYHDLIIKVSIENIKNEMLKR